MTQKEWEPADNIPQDIQILLDKANTPFQYINIFYQLLGLLKSQPRTGWVMKNISEPESIADHMYRMALISMTLKTKVDTAKCAKIALVHDISESVVGDIVPHDTKIDKVEKNKREYKTILYLSSIIEKYNPEFAKEIVELWLDYEEQRNNEAKMVKDIDKFELLVQTFEYEKLTSKRYDEFFDSRALIKSAEVSGMADDLIEERNKFWESKGLQ
ncbi:unnamed protein product [Kuraishia capsulata CBS 1993]|uniref:5'-deoxynucleotidase n=1 Tax=Kuraishia capsulata CBS 1993 TaxID=1382522 RepID=W6MFF3_9ASCO|nr:uncharacterized protein KUCA_T00000266001 [Kuraishia capsulata CBS 1993]CDK24306.1 unnamed protein product [Kuraishia capsulata CBS 1993]